jgi:hypothetical protein
VSVNGAFDINSEVNNRRVLLICKRVASRTHVADVRHRDSATIEFTVTRAVAAAGLLHVENLTALSAGDRVALRLNVYLVSETLNRMRKTHHRIACAGARSRWTNSHFNIVTRWRCIRTKAIHTSKLSSNVRRDRNEPEPGRATLVATRRQVEQGWYAVHDVLKREGHARHLIKHSSVHSHETLSAARGFYEKPESALRVCRKV